MNQNSLNNLNAENSSGRSAPKTMALNNNATNGAQISTD